MDERIGFGLYNNNNINLKSNIQLDATEQDQVNHSVLLLYTTGSSTKRHWVIETIRK